jgi:phage shock protein C
MAACVGCGESVVAGARFCSVCGRAVEQPVYRPVSAPPPPTSNAPLNWPPPASARLDGLYRPREGRMLAGVCAGFALRYGWDVSIVRLILVLSLIFGAGTPLVAYVIAWVVMPNGQYSLPAQATGNGPGSMGV